MKKNDLTVIITVAFFSVLVSLLISNKVFVTDKLRKQEVGKPDVITADFPLPDSRFFNKDSLNPTTNSGLENTNQTPFNGSAR